LGGVVLVRRIALEFRPAAGELEEAETGTSVAWTHPPPVGHPWSDQYGTNNFLKDGHSPNSTLMVANTFLALSKQNDTFLP
jgi:hypothetical protein